jgi:hypothetical protein
MSEITQTQPPSIIEYFIFHISGLSQIILDYLQYEESILLFSHFQCKEPIRPCIDMTRLGEGYSVSQIIPWSEFSQKENWYIPASDFEMTNKILYSILNLKPKQVQIYLQCPDCNNYIRVEYTLEEDIFRIKGYRLEYNELFIYFLCKCTALELIKSEKMENYSLGNKFITSTNCIIQNNYVSYKCKKLGGKIILNKVT